MFAPSKCPSGPCAAPRTPETRISEGQWILHHMPPQRKGEGLATDFGPVPAVVQHRSDGPAIQVAGAIQRAEIVPTIETIS